MSVICVYGVKLRGARGVYEQVEAAADGIIDFKLDESGEETRDLIRIRSMKDVGFDRRRYALTIDDLEVALEK